MVVFDKLNAGDIWGLQKKEVEASLMAGVGIFYTNLDHCSPYLFMYDPSTINYKNEVIDRLVGHALPLINDVIQTVNEFKKETQCMPDQDQIEHVGNVIYSVFDFMSIWIGFEGQTWNQAEKVEHLTINQMNDNIMNKKKANPQPDQPGKVEKFINDFFQGKAQLPEIHF